MEYVNTYLTRIKSLQEEIEVLEQLISIHEEYLELMQQRANLKEAGQQQQYPMSITTGYGVNTGYEVHAAREGAYEIFVTTENGQRLRVLTNSMGDINGYY